MLDENGENSSSQRYLFYGDSPIVYKADSSILDALISGIQIRPKLMSLKVNKKIGYIKTDI